jgi:serine/threonine protein kinase
MSDLIGKTIGQYRIVEQIGLGGMATVYKAFQPSIDRYVAIKILPKQLAQDPNFVKRFQHEARAIAALEHPHILPVHDFGTSEGHTYMVMRYVEGGTLTNLMGQSIPPERIVKIVGNIARALDYAHQQGVVHRDIKPSNILIDNHGAELLTDFGIAKMIEGSGDTQLTSAGSILGTPAYMAPEQAEGKPVDGRSDIYSLGVVLYELLTGQPPYRAETPLAVVLMHLNDPLPPPRTIRSDVPEPLERVVLKAMAKDPNQRFQTAAEMDKALQQALKEIESASTTADFPRPAPKTEQISEPLPTAPVKSGGLMVPLLIVGGVVALFLCLVGGGFITWAILANSDEQAASDTPAASGPVQANLPATPTSTEPVADSTQLPAPTPTTARSENDTVLEISELDGEILFEDRFDSNQHEWFTGEESDEYGRYKAEIVDGRYRLSHQADQDTFIWEEPADVDFDDFVVSVAALPVEYSAAFAYGLIFRRNESQELYTFEIDSDGFFFVNLREDEEWQSLVDFTELDAINSDGPNQLMVVADGSLLTFFINGVEAITIEDDTLDRGSVGVTFEIYEAGDNATVDFDNLVVRELSGPEQAETGNEIMFAEYFDTDINGWATGEFEDENTLNEITIEDGVYRLNVTAKNSAYVEQELPDQEFSDFVLTVEATPHDVEEHYSYGIAFREDEDFNSYTFEIGNDGLYTIQLYDGEWHTLKDWSSTNAINVGETNELMVIAADSTLSFFVNGEELTQLEDDTLSAGTVGFIIDIFEDDTSATVDFDNLVIREVGTGE